jgi:hypothetical protein
LHGAASRPDEQRLPVSDGVHRLARRRSLLARRRRRSFAFRSKSRRMGWHRLTRLHVLPRARPPGAGPFAVKEWRRRDMREKTSPETISHRKALSITGPELRVGFTDSLSGL